MMSTYALTSSAVSFAAAEEHLAPVIAVNEKFIGGRGGRAVGAVGGDEGDGRDLQADDGLGNLPFRSQMPDGIDEPQGPRPHGQGVRILSALYRLSAGRFLLPGILRSRINLRHLAGRRRFDPAAY
jgi:hypothetical protein